MIRHILRHWSALLLALPTASLAAQATKPSPAPTISAAERQLITTAGGSAGVIRTSAMRTRRPVRIPAHLAELRDGSTVFQEDPGYMAPLAAVGDTVTLASEYAPWETAIIAARVAVRAGDECAGGMPAKGWAYRLRRSAPPNMRNALVLPGIRQQMAGTAELPAAVRAATAAMQVRVEQQLVDSLFAEIGNDPVYTLEALRQRISYPEGDDRPKPWPVHPVRTPWGTRYLVAKYFDTDLSDHGFFTFVQLLFDAAGTVLQQSRAPAGNPLVLALGDGGMDVVYLGTRRLALTKDGFVVPEMREYEGCD